jgi:hypothetical protein
MLIYHRRLAAVIKSIPIATAGSSFVIVARAAVLACPTWIHTVHLEDIISDILVTFFDVDDPNE